MVTKSGFFAFLLVVTAVIATLSSCATNYDDLDDGLYAVMQTSRGEIVVYLDTRAPITVMNFVGLAEGTIQSNRGLDTPFYDGLTFHRVEPGFVVQGGDPNGDGSGNPGYRFPTETHPELLHDGPGVVAMANSGPDTNGCQFYFTLAAAPNLDGGYNVFGRVVRGMDVVESIQIGDEIEKVRILRIGAEASDYVATTELFQELIQTTRDAVMIEAAAKREADLEFIAGEWPDAVEIGATGVRKQIDIVGSGAWPEQGDRIVTHLTLSLLLKLHDNVPMRTQ